jgi:hypothetical protein
MSLVLALSCLGAVMGLMGSRNLVKHSVYSGRNVFMTATMMPPADLTPAVDKFVRLPDVPHAAAAVSPYTMTAKGPVPDGPDPFKYVADELSPLSEFVKELVVSENPVLTMAASHFFEKVCKLYEHKGIQNWFTTLCGPDFLISNRSFLFPLLSTPQTLHPLPCTAPREALPTHNSRADGSCRNRKCRC